MAGTKRWRDRGNGNLASHAIEFLFQYLTPSLCDLAPSRETIVFTQRREDAKGITSSVGGIYERITIPQRQYSVRIDGSTK